MFKASHMTCTGYFPYNGANALSLSESESVGEQFVICKISMISCWRFNFFIIFLYSETETVSFAVCIALSSDFFIQ